MPCHLGAPPRAKQVHLDKKVSLENEARQVRRENEESAENEAKGWVESNNLLFYFYSASMQT